MDRLARVTCGKANGCKSPWPCGRVERGFVPRLEALDFLGPLRACNGISTALRVDLDSLIGVNSMRPLLVAGAVALASVLGAHPASAFVIYSDGGGSSGSSLRSHYGQGSGVQHYGSFERGTMPAQSVIVNQGVLSPGWFFGRTRR
jgi:hypothetical protein